MIKLTNCVIETMLMSDYVIIPANIRDLDAIHALEKACFTEDIISLERYKTLLKRSSIRIFVMKDGIKIIASAILVLRKRSEIARIYSFAVDKSYRGTMTAKNFYEYLEKFLRKEHKRVITLEVKITNHAAIRFYEKNGFVRSGLYKDYYEDHSNAYRMQKVIA